MKHGKIYLLAWMSLLILKLHLPALVNIRLQWFGKTRDFLRKLMLPVWYMWLGCRRHCKDEADVLFSVFSGKLQAANDGVYAGRADGSPCPRVVSRAWCLSIVFD